MPSSKVQWSPKTRSHGHDSRVTVALPFSDRIQSCHMEMERSAVKEKKLAEDNSKLVERISVLEKECASLTLELKAVQNRYQQEVQSRENNEKSRIVNKEEANLEVVKGMSRTHHTLLRVPFLCPSSFQLYYKLVCTLQYCVWIEYSKVGSLPYPYSSSRTEPRREMTERVPWKPC